MTPGIKGPYRLFGTPFSVTLHQLAVCLHLRRLPTKLYCRDSMSVMFFATFFRSAGFYSCLTPEREVFFTQNALLDHIEKTVADSPDHPSVSINPKIHPHTFVMANAIHVYSHTWLVKTGTGYRFVYEPSSSIVLGLVSWVAGWILPRSLICNLKPVQRYIRSLMQRLLESHGMSRGAMPYHEMHFKRLCEALEAHFAANPGHRYVLLTSRPTLADVGLATAFSSYFLMDDGPLELLHESFPLTLQYAMRCACLSDPKGTTSDSGGQEQTCEFPGDRDTVVSTLLPVVELMIEVLPWTVAQVESFRRHMLRVEEERGRKDSSSKDSRSKDSSVDNCSFITLNDGPYKGLPAYPLKVQTSTFQYWMLIDKDMQSCYARGPDLEIAVRAGRNAMQVWEDSEEHLRPTLLPVTSDEVLPKLSTPKSKSNHDQKDDPTTTTTTTITTEESEQRSAGISLPSDKEIQERQSPMKIDANSVATCDFSLYCHFSASSNASLQSWKAPKKKPLTAAQEIDAMHDRIETILTLLARMHVPDYLIVSPMDLTRPKEFFVAIPIPSLEGQQKSSEK
jgi:hypothetical protein